MNKKESSKIIAILMASYPNFLSSKGTDEIQATVNVWNEMLTDYTYQEVGTAIKACITQDRGGFAPSIGQVIDKILSLRNKNTGITEQTAWALVNKAIKNSAYHATEEYEKLPDVVKKVIGGPSQLRDWALSENDGAQTVIASNFMRSYRTAAERERQYQALPADVKKLVENAMPMIGGGDNENGKNDHSGIPGVSENGQGK